MAGIGHSGGNPPPAVLVNAARILGAASVPQRQLYERLPIVRMLATQPIEHWDWLAAQQVIVDELDRERLSWHPLVTEVELDPDNSVRGEINTLFQEARRRTRAMCPHELSLVECAHCAGDVGPVPPGTTGGVGDGTGIIAKKARRP